MQTTILGRTGLHVSVAGLGCGGYSRLGQGYGRSRADSVALVEAAVDMGINFIDTAEFYGTEEIVGEAIRTRRADVIVSTKTGIVPWNRPDATPWSGRDVLGRLEDNLRRLGTDYIDLFNLHGVSAAQLDYINAEIVPALIKARDQGKVRFLGITEHFIRDLQHEMLTAAVPTAHWDVVMVGFNLLNPSARNNVLKLAQAGNIGVLDMYAVRRALSNPDVLKQTLEDIEKAGQLDRRKLDEQNPLGFLNEAASGTIDAAYRFCRHEPGIHVVLTGTGSVEHLKENVESIDREPLPSHTLAKLDELFGRVNSVSGG